MIAKYAWLAGLYTMSWSSETRLANTILWFLFDQGLLILWFLLFLVWSLKIQECSLLLSGRNNNCNTRFHAAAVLHNIKTLSWGELQNSWVLVVCTSWHSLYLREPDECIGMLNRSLDRIVRSSAFSSNEINSYNQSFAVGGALPWGSSVCLS